MDMTFKFSILYILPFSGASAASNSVSSSARAVGSIESVKFYYAYDRYLGIHYIAKHNNFILKIENNSAFGGSLKAVEQAQACIQCPGSTATNSCR